MKSSDWTQGDEERFDLLIEKDATGKIDESETDELRVLSEKRWVQVVLKDLDAQLSALGEIQAQNHSDRPGSLGAHKAS
jgi:hypothetical protein